MSLWDSFLHLSFFWVNIILVKTTVDPSKSAIIIPSWYFNFFIYTMSAARFIELCLERHYIAEHGLYFTVFYV